MKKVINLLLLALLSWSCSPSSKTNQGLIPYVENADHGLRKTVAAGDFVYTIQYKPTSYILMQEGRQEDSARKAQLQGMVWFNITFKVNDFNQSPLRFKVGSMEEYTARQDYFLNQAVRDLYLMYDGNVRLSPSAYWFENNQNLLPYETMIAGFHLPDGHTQPTKNMQVVFQDRVFDNGILKVLINQKSLEAFSDFTP